MRQYVIQQVGPTAEITPADAPDPTPGPGEVLVRMRACSLNYRDLMVLRGEYGAPKQLPLVPLSDGAGEVIALGPDVDEFDKGDRVAGCFFQNWPAGRLKQDVYGSDLGFTLPGVLSELRVFPQHGLVKLPRYMSFVEGATLPVAGLTAFNAVVPHVARGQTVLLLGTGGVSLFALQFAKASGATVIITSSDDGKLERAMNLGADHGVNYRTHENWDEEVLRLTGGHGVDLVVETAGAKTFEKSLNALAPGGRISQVGRLTGIASGVNIQPLVYKSATLKGIFVGSRQDFLAMNAFVQQINIAELLDDLIPFDEAPRAFERIASRRHFGKVVITLG
ncbi:MAG: NAD(P)-dependent alcohol dehydrogenase [Planctomycetes bacterium]|nr:NAD(P)-dependent alcohol dehydrogenase [Planctomycetota bacterium]